MEEHRHCPRHTAKEAYEEVKKIAGYGKRTATQEMKKRKEKHGTKEVAVPCAYDLIAGNYQNTQYELANLQSDLETGKSRKEVIERIQVLLEALNGGEQDDIKLMQDTLKANGDKDLANELEDLAKRGDPGSDSESEDSIVEHYGSVSGG